MTLNPELHAVLCKNFGEVHISNEDVERIEERIPGRDPEIIQRGEHYNINCPFCGDTRHRLSISYQWLTKLPLSNKRITHLVNCYNEGCEEPRSEEFYAPLLEDLALAEMGLLEIDDSISEIVSARTLSRVRLPVGYRRLSELAPDHPAIKFAESKYKIPYQYMSDCYDVGFTPNKDDIYWASEDRLIFPIVHNGELVAWQGRTICGKEPRWYLTPGFSKCIYNGDRVQPFETPVIAEGIPAAIACGPKGVCVFGKSITTKQAVQFADKWSSVIIATDPETFVEDPRDTIRKTKKGRIFANEMAKKLRQVIADVRMVRWPEDILDLARRKVGGDKEVKVPDPADMGLAFMRKLIEEAV